MLLLGGVSSYPHTPAAHAFFHGVCQSLHVAHAQISAGIYRDRPYACGACADLCSRSGRFL